MRRFSNILGVGAGLEPLESRALLAASPGPDLVYIAPAGGSAETAVVADMNGDGL